MPLLNPDSIHASGLDSKIDYLSDASAIDNHEIIVVCLLRFTEHPFVVVGMKLCA